MKTNFQSLHKQALEIATSYRRAESELISILQKIDECRGFREMGYKSLFDYSTQALKLSESVTFNLIAIARKSKEVPKLQEMIQDQTVSISNARMITPVLNLENQEKWLSAAASLSKRQLEKEIAKAHPEAQVREQSRYVSENRLEMRLGVSEELHDEFKRVQDLVSSQMGKAVNMEEALKVALKYYIEKNDPLVKASRVAAKNKARNQAQGDGAGEGDVRVQSQTQSQARKSVEHRSTENAITPVPGQVQISRPNLKNKRFIPSKLEQAILLRDHGRCSYQMPNGKRCSERRWLDIHHIVPLSLGGQTTLDNLKLVCRGHHQVLHHP
jgi:hypothetical protein